ncbi:MAG: hypothetical protein JXA01_10285 [Dehalococcoidia bacterium]|nr:hypothetical protein [Dehalococcoidia bacterium]
MSETGQHQMKKSSPASSKDKVLHGVLCVIAAVLTVIALGCIVLFHSSAGFLNNILIGHGTGMASMQDKTGVDQDNAGATGACDGLNATSYIESGYGNIGAGNTGGDSSSSAANATGDNGDSDTADSSFSSLDGGDTTDGDADGSGDTSGGSTGSSDDTSYAGDSDGTGGGDDSSTGGATTVNRIKSACFGGVGRCYVGE